jgi:Zn-dependent peptidase ImmA (M78 family)
LNKRLPKSIKVTNKKEIKIEIQDLKEKHLGYWDPVKNIIIVSKNQSLYSQWVTLFHEVLHILDDELITRKQKPKVFTEKSIEFGASAMLGVLIRNNFINLIDKETITEKDLFPIYRKRRLKEY